MGSFQRQLNNKSQGHQVVEDPTGTAPTKHVDRFEVRAGDCSADAVWSDCKAGSERSETVGPKEDRMGKEEWYGWYIYMPEDWKDVFPANNIYGAFHQADAGGVLTTRMANKGLHVWHALKDRVQPSYDIDLMRGKWTKIEMYVKWEKEVDGVMPDGFLNVYVNGEMLYTYKGATF